ncbi:MAG: protease modulator HflC [Candidatus Latescibacterota bacterium]|nr:protease modulator HflC [Candidatus Latescibacterota bacterium]
MRFAVGLVVVLIAAMFGANLVLFTVTEIEQVVVTQFGQPKRVITEPGLYFKLPDPFQRTTSFDKRLLEYDSNPDPIFTQDKKILLLDNYARWRIVDALVFMQALRTVDEALARIDDIVFSELRKELGQHELHEVVSTNREPIMQLVTKRANDAAKLYGLEIIDVRVKRADLPPENENAVYERMRAERDREAKGYRSEGEEQALKIRAETDLQASTIQAEAYERAQGIRGEGDAAALATYAEAYQKAANFYEFTRTLEAYETALKTETVLVQPADTDFFRYLLGRP